MWFVLFDVLKRELDEETDGNQIKTRNKNYRRPLKNTQNWRIKRRQIKKRDTRFKRMFLGVK